MRLEIRISLGWTYSDLRPELRPAISVDGKWVSKMKESKGKVSNEVLPEFLRCRVMGHAYDERTSTVQRGVSGSLEWTIKCHCGVARTQRISRDGFILGTSYAYPNGYVLKGKILHKEDKAELRLRFVTER